MRADVKPKFTQFINKQIHVHELKDVLSQILGFFFFTGNQECVCSLWHRSWLQTSFSAGRLYDIWGDIQSFQQKSNRDMCILLTANELWDDHEFPCESQFTGGLWQSTVPLLPDRGWQTNLLWVWGFWTPL